MTNEPIDSNGWLMFLDWCFDNGQDAEDPEVLDQYIAEGRMQTGAWW